MKLVSQQVRHPERVRFFKLSLQHVLHRCPKVRTGSSQQRSPMNSRINRVM
jgi:hypothetical protein